MEPRLLKGVQADYVEAGWPGENTSGLRPFGKNVLVRMDDCSTVTQGGISLPDDMIDKMSAAAETGCIFSIGPMAFTHFDDGTPWTAEKPQIGDRVYVIRYSGLQAQGIDGGRYRIMDYSCVVGGLDKTAMQTDEEAA